MTTTLVTQAQSNTLDSVRAALHHTPRTMLGLHNRTTFVNANNVTLYGFKIGLDYNRKILLYTGFYGLSNQNRKWLVGDERFNLDSIQQRTHYYNASVGVAYTIDQKPQLIIRVPVQLGIGAVVQDHYDQEAFLFRKNNLVIPVESGIDFSYALFEYLYLKAGAGYRLNLGNSEVLRLSAPYYNLGITVPLGALYRDLIEPEL